MDEYTTIRSYAEDEFVERRSRFIGAVKPVTTEEEALAFINEKRGKHWDASHNVYAYILRDGQLKRYSDDGEPQGTAGIPVLDVLQKEGLTDLVVVVTRYFGGILLGAGGLTRAYSKGAKDVLEAAGVCRMSQWTLWDVPCTYPLFERMKLEIQSCGGVVRDTEYGADILLRAAFPAGGAERFAPRLTEFSAGALEMLPDGEEFLPGPREAL